MSTRSLSSQRNQRGSASLPRLPSGLNMVAVGGANSNAFSFAKSGSTGFGGVGAVNTVTVSPFQAEREREREREKAQRAAAAAALSKAQAQDQTGSGTGRALSSHSQSSSRKSIVPPLDTSRLQNIVAMTEAQRDLQMARQQQQLKQQQQAGGSAPPSAHSATAAAADANSGNSAPVVINTDREVTQYIKSMIERSRGPSQLHGHRHSDSREDPLGLRSAAQPGQWPPRSENQMAMLRSAVIMRDPEASMAEDRAASALAAAELAASAAAADGAEPSSDELDAKKASASQQSGFFLDAWGKPRVFRTKVSANARLNAAAVIDCVRSKLAQNGRIGKSLNRTAVELHRAFRFFDLDNSGTVSRKDLEQALRPFNLMLPPSSVEDLITAFADHSAGASKTPNSQAAKGASDDSNSSSKNKNHIGDQGASSASEPRFSYPIFIQAIWLEALAEAHSSDVGGLPGDKTKPESIDTARLVQPMLGIKQSAELGAATSRDYTSSTESQAEQQRAVQREERIRALMQAQVALAHGNTDPSLTERDDDEARAFLAVNSKAGQLLQELQAQGAADLLGSQTTRSSTRGAGDMTGRRRRVPGTATFMPRYVPRSARSSSPDPAPFGSTADDLSLSSSAKAAAFVASGLSTVQEVETAGEIQASVQAQDRSASAVGSRVGEPSAIDAAPAVAPAAAIVDADVVPASINSSSNAGSIVARLSSSMGSKSEATLNHIGAKEGSAGAGAGAVDELYHYRTRNPNDAQWSFNNYGREWYTGDTDHRAALLARGRSQIMEHNSLHWSYNNRVGLENPLTYQPLVRGIAQPCYKSIEDPKTGQLVRDPYHTYPNEFVHLKSKTQDAPLPKPASEILADTAYGAQLSCELPSDLAPPPAQPSHITVSDALLACGCSVASLKMAQGADGSLICPCPKAHALAHARFGKAGCLHIKLSDQESTVDSAAKPKQHPHRNSNKAVPCYPISKGTNRQHLQAMLSGQPSQRSRLIALTETIRSQMEKSAGSRSVPILPSITLSRPIITVHTNPPLVQRPAGLA